MTTKTPQNPASRRPTAKQARFVEGLTDGKSARKAALDAGYKASSAAHASTEILPAVERSFGELIRSAIPAARLVQRLDEGLDAVEVKLASFEGQFTDERSVPDFAQRRAYAELIVKLGGYFVPVNRIETAGEPIDRETLIAKILGRRPGPGDTRVD